MSYNPENEIFSFDFVPDPRSGQPRLTCDRDDVGKRDLDLLSSELRENYEVLCAGSGSKTFEFKSRLLTLPQRYLVTTQQTDYTGMPRLHLTSLPGGNRDSSVGKSSLEVSCEASAVKRAGIAPQYATPREFSAPYRGDPAVTFGRDFGAALEELLAGIPQNAEQRFGTVRVLQDMRDLSKKRPLDFLLVLVAGYLQIARQFGSDDQRDLAYLAASHLIDELCCTRMEDLKDNATGKEQPLYARNSRRLWKTIIEE